MQPKFSFLRIYISAFLLLLFIHIEAQTGNDYSKQWKQVDEFIKKGLTKSALDETIKIMRLLKKIITIPR